MILYYAMGGGLGHLTRTLAILSQIDTPQRSIRVLVSSQHAQQVLPHMPCPVDVYCPDAGVSRQDYYAWLATYLEKYQIQRVVLDTFPFGLFGEWAHVAQDLPKDLLARSLKWSDYHAHVVKNQAAFPRRSLVIEPLGGYELILQEKTEVTYLQGPIVLSGLHASLPKGDKSQLALIVHSGNAQEQQQLETYARQQLSKPHHFDLCYPRHDIYPAEMRFNDYTTIVAGAGYNMIANAWAASKDTTFLFYPFERRYDDQCKRLQSYRAETWLKSRQNASREAAAWIMDS